MNAVRCRLYRGADEVDTWVVAALPADPGRVNHLLRWHRDRAIGADTRTYRCDIHDARTDLFLYRLEEAP